MLLLGITVNELANFTKWSRKALVTKSAFPIETVVPSHVVFISTATGHTDTASYVFLLLRYKAVNGTHPHFPFWWLI